MINDKTPDKLADIIRDTWPQIFWHKKAGVLIPGSVDLGNSSVASKEEDATPDGTIRERDS
jgi:hypothetical protein